MSKQKHIRPLHTRAFDVPDSKRTRAIPLCPFGRRLVISDIHGCASTFTALLDKVQFSRNDQLFLLGDFISRGRNSGAVIDRVLELQRNGYEVYCLRGNHEQMVLDCMELRPFAVKGLLMRLKARGLTNKFGRVKKRYERFMRSLYWYFELDDFILVHAGLNFKHENPLADYVAMLNIRRFKYRGKLVQGKRIVHGHSRTGFEDIRAAVKGRQPVVCIDNGCHQPKKAAGHGRLVCFDLTNNKLVSVKNREAKALPFAAKAV